jgi:hypothetical protein
MPHDLARQIRIQRFATTLATRVTRNLCGWFVLTRRRGVSTERFSFVKQAELVSRTSFARCAEQLVPVGTQPLFRKITLGLCQTKLITQCFALREQRLILFGTQCDDVVRHGRLDRTAAAHVQLIRS